MGQPLLEVHPDWERAAELGISPRNLGYTIWAYSDGAFVDNFFLDDDQGMPAVGADGLGNFLKAQIFDEEPVGLPAAYFTLEQLPSTVMAGQNLTVQVVARDQNGEVVQGFAGTVRFSSSDDRATLPNDYVFTPTDQGMHTYYLAVKFGTPGEQTIAVHDLNDFRISGELNVEVKSGMAPIDIPSQSASVSITFPANGGASSASRVTIFGEATKCAAVTITDGPIELIHGLEVDSAGSFVYQTPRLADGYHEFLATCDEDATVISEKVRLKVDTSAPQVADVQISPAGMVQPGQEVSISVLGTEPLTAAQVVLDGFATDLMVGPADGSGLENDGMTFSGTVVVPNEPGQYPISVVIVDELGNRFETATGGVINVGMAGSAGDGSEGGDAGGTGDAVDSKQVFPLVATDGEVRKVTLSWTAPADAEGLTQYRVQYGIQGQPLTGVNMTPDARTSWYVGGLEPGVTYDFQVTGVYPGGDGVASNIAAGTPIGGATTEVQNLQATSGEIEKSTLTWEAPIDTDGLQKYQINFGLEGMDLLGQNITPDTRTSWYVDGLEPGVTYDFQVTPIYQTEGRGVPSNVAPGTPALPDGVAPTAVSNLQATSGEVEQVSLLWSPADDDLGIRQYRINYAVAGEELVMGTFTPDDRTSFVVRGLEACVKYQFKVTAVDTDGLSGPASGVGLHATDQC